jgi:hypothetical protein
VLSVALIQSCYVFTVPCWLQLQSLGVIALSCLDFPFGATNSLLKLLQLRSKRLLGPRWDFPCQTLTEPGGSAQIYREHHAAFLVLFIVAARQLAESLRWIDPEILLSIAYRKGTDKEANLP